MPQRFLRPGLTESDRWNLCSFEAQSMFVRLLTLVDDFGRYDGRVAVLHAHCFALRPDIKPQRTAALRSELQTRELIDVYSVGGKDYLQILRWQERSRSEKSKYPDPQDSAAERRIRQEKDASLVPRSSSIVPSPLARNGEQGLFKKPSPEEARSYGEQIGLTSKEVESWYDHFQSNGWKVGGRTKMLDWQAALRNAKRRQRELNPRQDDWKAKTKIV